ncbi:MAG: Smr/MutS family protein [Ruminiclostridium sp.]|nr:Smr/MutS family protein [Ruminiclostridium sp.]
MKIISVDLHGMTKDEARNKLTLTIRNAPKGSVELRVTHGCNNGNVLQQMVRKEFRSPRIDYIQPVLSNDGQTLVFLK